MYTRDKKHKNKSHEQKATRKEQHAKTKHENTKSIQAQHTLLHSIRTKCSTLAANASANSSARSALLVPIMSCSSGQSSCTLLMALPKIYKKWFDWVVAWFIAALISWFGSLIGLLIDDCQLIVWLLSPLIDWLPWLNAFFTPGSGY